MSELYRTLYGSKIVTFKEYFRQLVKYFLDFCAEDESNCRESMFKSTKFLNYVKRRLHERR